MLGDPGMNSRVFIFVNAIVAAGLFIVGGFGFLSEEFKSEPDEVTGFFVAATWFVVIATGFAFRGRLLVLLSSVPVILAVCTLFLALIFAGFAWDKQGMSTAQVLQAISFVIVILQVLGLIGVFTEHRKKMRTATTLPNQAV